MNGSKVYIFTFSDYIKPVYLPTVDLIDNLSNTAIGWGQISDGKLITLFLFYVNFTFFCFRKCWTYQ